MNKKLKKWIIGLGITGTILSGGYLAKANIMPEPTNLPTPISSTDNYLGRLFANELEESEIFDLENIKIIRYGNKNPKFAQIGFYHGDSFYVRDINSDANSLSDLLRSGVLEKIVDGEQNYLSKIKEIKKEQLLSPITTPRNIIGIGYNYLEHSKEVGETNEFKGKNMVAFRKESNSLSGPFDSIVRPEEVKLLDYEAELGLVLGKRIDKDTEITKDNFQDFIAGYVLVNDISARDIQLLGGSLFDKIKGFRKGKSYSGFCPTGPVFSYNDSSSDFELYQHLQRNKTLHHLQKGNSSEMVNSPYEIVKELQKRLDSDNKKEYRIFIDKNGNRNHALEIGDLIATGTPSGVAFNFDVKYVISCGGKNGFIKFEQENNEKYLKSGDSLITFSKGLGYQKHEIK